MRRSQPPPPPSSSQPPPSTAAQHHQQAQRQRDNWHTADLFRPADRQMQQAQQPAAAHQPAQPRPARRSYSVMSQTQPAAAAAAAAAASSPPTAAAAVAASANRSLAAGASGQRPQQQQQHAAAAAAASSAVTPSLDARASKRVRRSPSCKVDGASSMTTAAAAAAGGAACAAFAHSTAAALAAASKEQQEELQCVVCQELPPCIVYQCGNGHLLCKPCHTRVLNESRPSCPMCRMRLSRQHPSRNRFAEGVKSRLRVPCTQAGCSELVVFSQLSQHLATQCGYRRAICMYEPLGCDWSGIAIQHQQHENECPIRGMSARKLLALVRKRNEAYEAQVQAVKKAAQVQTHLCHMLSKRCRDLCVRDLVIERDMSTGAMCTKPFKACGLLWEVFLDPPPTNQVPAEVKIHLRIVEPLKRKTTIECFCLNGPGLEGADVPPTLRRVVFRRRVTQSESFLLPFNAEQSRLIHASDSVSLRLGLLDCSAGVTASTFTTLNLTADQRQRMEQDALEEAQSDSDDSDAPIDDDDADADADVGFDIDDFLSPLVPVPDADIDDEDDDADGGYLHADAVLADGDSEMHGELLGGVAGESDGRSSEADGHDDDAIYEEQSDGHSVQRSSGDEGGASEEEDIGAADEGSSDLEDTQPSSSAGSSAPAAYAAAVSAAAASAAHRSLSQRSPHVPHSAHSGPSGRGVQHMELHFHPLDHAPSRLSHHAPFNPSACQ